MSKSYIPIFLDWRDTTCELSAEEKGRLVDALIAYANGEDPQEIIEGNERFVFPVFKRQIDRDNEISTVRAENGAAGGSKPKQNKQTEANESKMKQTEANESKTPKENNNNKEKEKENNNKNKNNEDKRAREERFDRFWAAYPRKQSKDVARKSFERINPDDDLLAVMLKALEVQKRSDQWTRDGGQFIPHPSTWLNQGRWTDEMPTGHQGKAVNAQKYEQRTYTETEMAADDDWILKEIMKEDVS